MSCCVFVCYIFLKEVLGIRTQHLENNTFIADVRTKCEVYYHQVMIILQCAQAIYK